MNYWKQFAKMLGLKLGQEFILTDSDGKRKDGYTYKITKNGILFKSQINDDWHSERSDTIERLLEGYDKAVPKPWKPKEGERYWFRSKALNQTISRTWCDQNYDLLLWKVGNCFRTKEEAQTKGKEIMEQIQKEFDDYENQRMLSTGRKHND